MAEFEGEFLDIEGPEQAGPPVEKVHDFYVTTIGGLEDVVLKDLKAHLKSISKVRVEQGRRYGRIFFTYQRSPRHLLTLRSVEGVFALLAEIGGITVGGPGLLRIAERVARVDLIPAAVLHDVLHGAKAAPGFQLACTGGRGHRFSASEMHQVVRTVLEMKYDVDPDESEMPYPLRLQVVGKRALFGLQLSSRSMRERSVEADPEPSLAYCLALMLGIDRRDVVLDPRCGGATALIEGGIGRRCKAMIGGDAYREVLLFASENLKDAGLPARLIRWEGEALPLRDATVDKVIGNLQRRKGESPVFLREWMREIWRVLRPGRRGVFLVEGRKQMGEVLEDPGGFQVLEGRTIHLRGKRSSVYVLKKVN